MSPENQQRIFISYSRVNKDFAVDLAKELKSSGFSVWLDVLDISTGARWDDEVEKALATCGIFMVILTPTSVASENVKDEIGYAIDHGKRIVPVLLENAAIPLRLRRFQYVDFSSKSYEEGVESAKQLLSSLGVERSLDAGPILERMVGIMERREDKPAAGSRQKTSSSRRVVPLILGGLAVASLLIWGVVNFLGSGSAANSNTTPTAYVIEFDDQKPLWDECYSIRQDMNPFGGQPWREADHLFGAGLNCRMGFQISVFTSATYRLALYATYAPDFGILDLFIERGEDLQKIYVADLYDPQVRTTNQISLGDWELRSDQTVIFSLEVVGKNPSSSNYKIGLDFLALELIP